MPAGHTHVQFLPNSVAASEQPRPSRLSWRTKRGKVAAAATPLGDLARRSATNTTGNCRVVSISGAHLLNAAIAIAIEDNEIAGQHLAT